MNGPAVTALARACRCRDVRLGARDVAGLVLLGDMYGTPYDLLAAFLGVRPDRLRGIVARWRTAGYVATGRLGAGPAWCWLTRAGLAVTGQPYTQARPAAARLAHIRAVLAVRLSLEASPAYQDSRAWWRPERRIRAAIGGRATGHVPDAEVSWPDVPASAYATITHPPPPPWPPSSPKARSPTSPLSSLGKIILRICHATLEGPDRHDQQRFRAGGPGRGAGPGERARGLGLRAGIIGRLAGPATVALAA
jgi:hypothetical protein